MGPAALVALHGLEKCRVGLQTLQRCSAKRLVTAGEAQAVPLRAGGRDVAHRHTARPAGALDDRGGVGVGLGGLHQHAPFGEGGLLSRCARGETGAQRQRQQHESTGHGRPV